MPNKNWPSNSIFRSSPSDDLVNSNSGLSVCLSVRPSIRSQKVFLILMCGWTSTGYAHQYDFDPIQGQKEGHWFYAVPKTALFRSIFTISAKLLVDYDNMGSSLQLVGAGFLNFLLSKLSFHFKLREKFILQDFQRVIFPYCLRLESRGWVC